MSENKIYLLLVVACSIFISLACLRKSDPYSSKFSDAQKTGTISSIQLTEASGIAGSRSIPDHLWVINDSGNDPTLLLIDSKGQLIQTYWIENTLNFDWEDIAIYTNQETGENTIYIADVGDNFAIRPFINIIIIQEPSSLQDSETRIRPMANYYFRYEDGPRDAETLLVDPHTSELYIITKREKHVRVYAAPGELSDTDTMQLSFRTDLPFHNITAGDISRDGEEILLKSYDGIFYWRKSHGETVVETLSRPHELLRYQPEPQGEAIAWEVNGKGYYTLSEKNAMKDQVLYYYKRH